MTEYRKPAWPKRFTEALRVRLWWLLALVLLLLALYVVLARQFMVMVPDLREPLEAWLTERLNMPVEIASLEGRMEGLTPVFELEQVRIRSRDEQENEQTTPLELDRVELRPEMLASLVHRAPRLKELRVRGAAIHLNRDEQGPVRLYGMTDAAPLAGESGHALRDFLEPLYRQQRLVLEDVHAVIDWPGLPRMRTADLSLHLFNTGVRHHLAVRFSMRDRPLVVNARVHLDDDVYDLDQVSGRGFVHINGRGLEYWLPEQRDWRLSAEELNGEIELWGRLRNGRVEYGTMRLGARDLLLKHQQARTRWSLAGLSLRAGFRRLDDGFQVDLDRFSARTGTGPLEAGPLSVQWRERTGDTHWRLRTAELDVAVLREQLLAWPFPLTGEVARLRDTLAEFAPGGRFHDLYLRGRNQEPEHIAARMENMELATDGERPGFSRLSGWVSGDASGGRAWLDSDALVLHLPEQFRDPLTVDLRGPLRWERDEDDGRLDLFSGRMHLDNPDARVETLFSVHAREEEVPELRLRAILRDGMAANAARYAPLEHLDTAMADWLSNAFHGGRVRSGRMLYEGPVLIDPARQQDRTQQLLFDVEDVRLHFAPGWPLLEEVSGRVLLDGRDVSGEGVNARLHDSRVDEARFRVPESPPDEAPLLEVSGRVHGPVADLDAVLRDTPLAGELPAGTTDWALRKGELDADLELELPLAESSREPEARARGRVREVQVASGRYGLAFDNLRGEAQFSLAEGLQAPYLTASFLGHPVGASVISDAQRSLISLAGQLDIAALGERHDHPWLTHLEGRAPFGFSLALPRERGEVAMALHSSLEGIGVTAPLPLGKTPAEALPLRLGISGLGQGTRLELDYADRFRGVAALDEEQALQRARVHFAGEDAPTLPEQSGLYLDGRVAELDLPAWVAFMGDGEAALGNGRSLPGSVELDLEADEFRLGGALKPAGRLRVSRVDEGWRMMLDSEPLVAELALPENYLRRGEHPLSLDIGRLYLDGDREAPEDADASPLEGLDPLDVPVMNLILDDVRVGGEPFGRWEARVRPLDDGVRMESLQGNWRDARITGRLDWRHDDDGQYSHFDGEVYSQDLARTLEAWGIPPFIESEDASSFYDVRWRGSPLEFDYLAVNGTGRVRIHDCVLPGRDRRTSALQVLGLVNIANITRRLRLDFSDVYQRGLTCDRIRGSFSMDGPVISTDRLSIRSPQAHFVLSGSMDISARTLDHELEIVLPLSSNLYAGCLAGPAACAGIFMVERLWGDRLERYTTLGYRVTGDWEDPDVEETRGLLER